MQLYVVIAGVLILLFLAYCCRPDILLVYGCIITAIVIEYIGYSSNKTHHTNYDSRMCINKSHATNNKYGGDGTDYYYEYTKLGNGVPVFLLMDINSIADIKECIDNQQCITIDISIDSPVVLQTGETTSKTTGIFIQKTVQTETVQTETVSYKYYIKYPQTDNPINVIQLKNIKKGNIKFDTSLTTSIDEVFTLLCKHSKDTLSPATSIIVPPATSIILHTLLKKVTVDPKYSTYRITKTTRDTSNDIKYIDNIKTTDDIDDTRDIADIDPIDPIDRFEYTMFNIGIDTILDDINNNNNNINNYSHNNNNNIITDNYYYNINLMSMP